MTRLDKDQMPLDHILTAFIDGELDQEDAASVEAMIKSDPSIAERFHQLSNTDFPYAQAFAPLLEAAPKERLTAILAAIPPQEKPDRSVQTRRRFLALAAAFVVAGIAADRAFVSIGGWLNQRGEGEEWRAVVANYIELYTADTLSAPVPDSTALTAQLARVGSKIGLSLKPEAIAVPGADFRRAQVLEYDGQPLVQLAYLDPASGPLALCIVPSRRGAAMPDTERRRGLNIVYWSTADHAFMLIGHADIERVQSAAEEVRAKLGA